MASSFGEFLRQKRQEKNLTQKGLAKLIFVSESAVSKWEKNAAHPDITLLPKLSEILGVTEHELITASVDNDLREEKSQAKKWRVFSLSWSLFFYIAYSITILTCFICNLAVSGTLSWFWIVVSALLLSFSFTNLPKIICKHRLLLLPLSMFLSLCLLLGVCCIYSKGDWFWIASLSVLLGLVIIFAPIYIAKYPVFARVRKFNDFISIAIDFVMLNILLIVIYICVSNSNAGGNWYIEIALPITLIVYAILNILLCVRFFKLNKLLKTSIVLLLINLFVYVPPMFIKINNKSVQSELIDNVNILQADLSNWNIGVIENNIHVIIFLTILTLAVVFLLAGVIRHIRIKRNS